MALSGTIGDFGVADIFQLIGQQAKSGVLHLRDEVDEIRVYFESGSVVRVESPTRSMQAKLGAMMRDAGLIAQVQLEAALDRQSKNRRPLASVLRSMNLVEESDVHEFISLQTQETLYRLFMWERGTYEFTQERVLPDRAFKPMRAEAVLMEGLRRLDEWPELHERFPRRDMVFRVARPLGGDEAETLDESELRIFGTLEKQRSLDELVKYCRVGEFETYRAIASLLDRTLIRPIEPERREARRRRVPKSPPVEFAIQLIVYCVLLTALLGLLRAADLGRFVGDGGQRGVESRDIADHLARPQIRVLESGLEVYRLHKGKYPKDLRELVEAGILHPRDLRFPYQEPYFYEVDDSEVTVLPPLF